MELHQETVYHLFFDVSKKLTKAWRLDESEMLEINGTKFVVFDNRSPGLGSIIFHNFPSGDVPKKPTIAWCVGLMELKERRNKRQAELMVDPHVEEAEQKLLKAFKMDAEDRADIDRGGKKPRRDMRSLAEIKELRSCRESLIISVPSDMSGAMREIP